MPSSAMTGLALLLHPTDTIIGDADPVDDAQRDGKTAPPRHHRGPGHRVTYLSENLGAQRWRRSRRPERSMVNRSIESILHAIHRFAKDLSAVDTAAM